MLNCLMILLYSTSVLAIPTGQNEVVYPSLETLRSGIKIMKFSAFDQEIELKLEPAGDVISDDIIIIDKEDNIAATDVKSFKEKLYRDQKKRTALYINENEFIEIEGTINSKLTIQPSGSQKVRDGMREHLITETLEEEKHFKDAVYNLNWTRSFSEDNARDYNENQCVEIEYFFLAEKDFSEKFPDLEDFHETVALTLIQVQTMMDSLNLKIKVRLIGVQMLKFDPPFITDSLFPGQYVFSSEDIMENMKTHVCKSTENPNYKRANVVMFVTGKNIGFKESNDKIQIGVLGLAFLGGMCEHCTKAALVKWMNNQLNNAYTIAHETAHLLGSPHDGATGQGFQGSTLPGSPGSGNCPATDRLIMGNRYFNSWNGDTFSTCSRENIKFFLGHIEASCVIKQC